MNRGNDIREARPLANGLRLSLINNVLVAAAVVVSAVLLYAGYRTIEGYNGLQTATERYITCQQNAELFQEASDYLTNECRYFAVTGEVAHAMAFEEEVETTKRREKAIEGIRTYLEEAASYGYLAQGMEYSNALAERETYAMRLAAEGWGCDPQALPEAISSIALTAEDAALSGEEKKDAALEMLFGEAYQAAKADIYACVEKSVNALIDDTRQQQIDSFDRLSRLLYWHNALVVLLLVIMAAVVLATYLLVIRPLQRCVTQIRTHHDIPVTGSREMRFLAQTYNDMFAQHTKSTEALTYSATHDSLTGVYNRMAYDAECRNVDQATVGVLIIDVDHFKTYNDNYGHDVGDRVLKRVAQVLTESFRSADFVSRIGGDEFCVIMKQVNSQLRDLVAAKIERANQRLQHPEDDLPPVSLSVGVAFGDRQNPSGDIFKDADTALYAVKRTGRGSCAFY